MCGIAGIIDLVGARPIDQAMLKRMTDALAHRGPDGEGFFIAPGVGLGHRRLAIIDIEGGAQPIEAQSGGGVLVFNGEIYNFEALKRTLSARVDFRTRSDAEVLAEGLSLKGPDFVHELRGMFACAFWEPGARRLTLTRDRLGERPLYYAETRDGLLVFASEIGAIAASGLIETSIDPQAAADYFFYGYVPDPKSIWRGVAKLPAGSRLIAEPGKALRIERYWRPVFASGTAASFEDSAAMLRERIDDAVRAQMIADVPLGAFLSGGVDSAAIVSAMAQTGTSPVTLTVGFDESSHDEREPARDVAARFGAVHHERLVRCDAAELIDRIAAAFGEPFADASALPSFLVAQMARQYVTVALSGDGGDEIFAGYRRYPFYLAEERVRALAPSPLRRAVFGPLGALYPKLDWAPRPLRFKTTLEALGQSAAEAYAGAVAINLPSRMRAVLSGDFTRSLGGYRPHTVIEDAMLASGSNDVLSRAQYADLMTWLPGRMLTKVDRTAMANSLEVRPPLLDHRLVEWAGTLPPRYKLDAGAGKRVLKAAVEPRLGADYLARRKQGFAPPLSQWLRRETGNPLSRLAESRTWRESGMFEPRAVEALMRAHRSGRADASQELWTVIMFDAFLTGRATGQAPRDASSR